ncbi:hypothetical protein BR1R5_30510 [Pseudomonas sp. BR1R-5]|uniref:hypothetical protein n=1 Tax=Pseudomonas sp. BR1R-5 TaxID=3003626 RepID=UPI0022BC9DBA|nr:hypothetical protein [Pseudomonas sp. BR1R-5]GLH33663.1 hypothetical protein BR1R5_30510 [Pseudomonas sp. BR1R-5]
MAELKTTTMIYKHLNYKNNGKGMSALFKSLAHSLRIAPTVKNKILATKVLEWDENRSHLNYIWTPEFGNAPVKLDTLSEKQKVSIQENFIAPIVNEQKIKDEKSELLDTLSKYKSKINKWHNSLTSDDPLKAFLVNILSAKNVVDIEVATTQLQQFAFARKNQKTESVKKYLELHNKVTENRSDLSRNKIFVQEAFFKIPLHNNVHVSTADLITNINSFYKVNFPDYPIKLIVFHGDEMGNHPHIFVDAKNKRTGKYDLLTAQKHFVNDNIDKLKAEYPEAEALKFSRNENDYFDKKLQAQYFQTLFYQHANKMLAKYNVQAKKLENTKENNARMALIEADAKKPKIQRQYSFYNAQLKEQQQAILDADEELIKKTKSIELIDESSKELLKINRDLVDENETLMKTNYALETKIANLSERFDMMVERLKDIASSVSAFVVDLMTKNNAQKSRYDIEAKQNDFYQQFETHDPVNSTLEKMAETAQDYKIRNELLGLRKL